MSGFLLVNPLAGKPRPDSETLVREAEARGIRCHVLARGDDPGRLAQEADAEALGVAGGDGSLAPVAGAALERALPFVCIPFGTRNHFARDLGLDRDDPVGALDAFVGAEREVDVGRVNGRVFLNNVSLGAYAGLVHRREHHRRRGEALAQLRALWRLAGERHRLHARVGDEQLVARALLVASNAYDLSLFTLGERPSLEEGRLHLYSAAGRFPRTWEERSATAFRIELDRARFRAAIDGEPAVLDSPLDFELLPCALRVLLPPGRPE